MAHLPPDAAIFSPSVARLAASTAKDWSYVDSWLASKYNGRPPPSFERNSDTLKALLALATLNESADENRNLLARVDADALREIKTAEDRNDNGNKYGRRSHHDEQDEDGDDGGLITLPTFKDDFFAALEGNLTKEGTASLTAMATASIDLGIAFPSPPQLGQAMLDLQARALGLDQAAARVTVLQHYLASESARLENLLREVSGDDYRPPASGLARQNVEMQRRVKTAARKLPEMKDKVSSLARTVGLPNPTIEQVRHEEERYLELLEVKRGLDQQLGEFEGLPPDADLARQQLDALRRELRSITERRDAVFENLVERETPRKGR